MKKTVRTMLTAAAMTAAMLLTACANADFAVDTTSIPQKTESVTPRVTSGPKPTAAPAKLNPLEDEFSDSSKADGGAPEGASGKGMTNSGVNVHVSPKGETVDSIPDHVEVEILGRQGNWFEVRYESVQGYIYGQFLDIDGVNALELEE